MKITFLGTAAANAYPEAFCSCENCTAARQLGGPSLRKRSSILVNDDLLIDLGPDIMAASQMHGISLTNVQYCLQTHCHADHLDLSHLNSRSPGYGVIGAPKLHLYASEATLKIADRTFQRDLADFSLLDSAGQQKLNLNLEIHHIEPYQPTKVGPYQVTAFPANHAYGTEALLYAVEEGSRCFFYGLDTASLYDEVWDAFHQLHLQFDLLILDHTYGPNEPESDHLNAAGVARHIQRMAREGLLKAGAKAYASHIAHEGNPPHPQLREYALAHGYDVAYDGLVVAIG